MNLIIFEYFKLWFSFAYCQHSRFINISRIKFWLNYDNKNRNNTFKLEKSTNKPSYNTRSSELLQQFCETFSTKLTKKLLISASKLNMCFLLGVRLLLSVLCLLKVVKTELNCCNWRVIRNFVYFWSFLCSLPRDHTNKTRITTRKKHNTKTKTNDSKSLQNICCH